jgi:hypothetical protein
MSVVTIAEAWPAAGRPFTVAELDRMPDDGRRCELLDGALVVSPRPTTIHQFVALAGEALNIFFSPYPERGSLAMTASSTCSNSVSGRPAVPETAAAAPETVTPEDTIVLFR